MLVTKHAQLAVITMAIAILAGACGDTRSQHEQVSWSLQTSEGTTVTFPNQRKGPAIVLFWATWCPYCKALMPHLQDIANEYDGELEIYAISYREDGDPLAYLQQNDLDFTQLMNGDAVAEEYGISGVPSLFLFDQQNRQVLDLSEVMERYNDEFGTPDNLSNSAKAARKAPWWADQIRAAVKQL